MWLVGLLSGVPIGIVLMRAYGSLQRSQTGCWSCGSRMPVKHGLCGPCRVSFPLVRGGARW